MKQRNSTRKGGGKMLGSQQGPWLHPRARDWSEAKGERQVGPDLLGPSCGVMEFLWRAGRQDNHGRSCAE